MQFQVPQFLDVEDKVIGPLTIKQFLYIVGSVGLGYIAYRFIPYIGLFVGLACIGLGWALGYYKPNKKPFVDMLESAFYYIKSSRLYVWKRSPKKEQTTEINLDNFKTTTHVGASPTANTGSKLSDLAWAIDVETKTDSADKIDSDSAVI